MNLDKSFSCYLMSVLTLNIIVLRKYRLIFELFHSFLSYFSLVRLKVEDSVKSRNQFFVGQKLMFVMVLYSIIGLFLSTKRFQVFSFSSINAYILIPCRLAKLS